MLGKVWLTPGHESAKLNRQKQGQGSGGKKTTKPVWAGSDGSHDTILIVQDHPEGIASLSPSKLFNSEEFAFILL